MFYKGTTYRRARASPQNADTRPVTGNICNSSGHPGAGGISIGPSRVMNRYSLRGRSSKSARAAAKLSESRIILRKLVYLVLVLGALGPGLAWSQTPSPLQEWQYSGGIALAQLFEPKQPDWRVITGLAAEAEPVYSGASGHPDLWRPGLQHPLQRYCLSLRRRGPRLQLFARNLLSRRRVGRL